MGSPAAVGASERRSVLERVLCLFTDVRPGEGMSALAMVANVFLILCAYYFIKSLRDGWLAGSSIAGLSKMEVKAYTSFAQGLVLIPVVSLYARLAARWPRRTLILRSTFGCILVLAGFWLVRPGTIGDQLPGIGVAFYIWVGMFGVFVVSQFWAFAADFYCDDRGRRLLPMVAIGATSGAAGGSFFTERMVGSGVVDGSDLLLLAALPLAGSMLLTAAADRRGPAGGGGGSPRGPAAPPSPAASGHEAGILRIILHDRFLLAVAAVTLLTFWVSTNGENLLFQAVQEAIGANLAAHGVGAAEAAAYIRRGTTAFYGSFFFWVNLCALVLQAFFASRLLKYGGFALIFLLLPVICLLTYSAMALLPLLWVVRVMKTAENAASYSINNTARHVLWLPTTAAMKYTAKPAIETFFVRLGDGLAAVTILVGVRLVALSTQSFFALNVVLVVGWLLTALIVVRAHRRLAPTPAEPAATTLPAVAGS